MKEPAEQRFKRVVREQAAKYEQTRDRADYPTAAVLLPQLGHSLRQTFELEHWNYRYNRRNDPPVLRVVGGARLDGRESKWRREVLLGERGWVQTDSWAFRFQPADND